MNTREIQSRELTLLADHINRAGQTDLCIHDMVDPSGTPLYSIQQPVYAEYDPEDFDSYDFDTLLDWCSYEHCMLSLEGLRIRLGLPEPTEEDRQLRIAEMEENHIRYIALIKAQAEIYPTTFNWNNPFNLPE